jgi:septal ring factor EnvC (AmiA/AmiB activator)
MGEKSTVIRDQYADELRRFMDTVPIADWPRYRNTLSRSGLADAIKARGFSSFDRKRLKSRVCRPIVKEMEARLDAWLLQLDRTNPSESETLDAAEPSRNQESAPSLKQVPGEIRKLEKALARSQEEARRLKSRCAELTRDLEHADRQQSAFERHCRESLRTLHV